MDEDRAFDKGRRTRARHVQAEREPAFEVHRLHLVGLSRRGAAVSIDVINAGPAAATAAHTQAMALQHPGDRAARRRRGDAVIALQHRAKLLRPPRAIQSSLEQDQRSDCLVRAGRTVQRPR